MSDNDYIKLNRESLYNEIWEISVSGVSKKYNIPYDKVRNLCKEMNIPIPKSGYWTKLEFGKPVTKTPLPEFSTNEIDFSKFESRASKAVTFSDNNMSTVTIDTSDSSVKDKKPIIIKETYKFLSENEYVGLLEAAANIKITIDNKRLHKKIKNYQSVVKEWNKNDRKAEFAQRKYDHYSNNPPFLAGVISKSSLPRVYKILDVLYRQVEELGGSINDDLSLKIRNEHIVLRITEAQDKVAHKITKAEARDLLIYEDERKRRSWAIEPKIRRWDYIINGRLTINISGKKSIKDTDKVKIEDRLGELLIKLYEESEVVRKNRIAAEEARRKKEEEERLRKENKTRYNEEIDKTVALLNIAEDYDKACKIRAYVSALECNCEDDEVIEWAKKKADWFDPTIRSVDEILGKREYEENEELKMQKKGSYGW